MLNNDYRSRKQAKSMQPSSFPSVLVHTVKELKNAAQGLSKGPGLHCQRAEVLLLSNSPTADITRPSRTLKPLWEEQHSWPAESPVLMPCCPVRKWHTRVFYLCLNKNTETTKEKEKQTLGSILG